MKKRISLILAAVLVISLGVGAWLFFGGEAEMPTGTEAEVHSEFAPDYPTVSPTEPSDPEAILAYRRDVVEAAMREQSAILWSPAEDVTYSMYNASSGIAIDAEEHPESVVTLYANRVYQGIPYTHGSGSYYSWLSFATGQNEKGVYTLTGLTDQLMTGQAANRENRHARIGNDCADQLFWAWARISSTIRFQVTTGMTEFNGCLKVGDYEYDGNRFNNENNTRQIVDRNGEQRMFRAYAQLQKGDGMVLVNRYGEGHAVMVVSVHVEYTASGDIDKTKSYVTVLEQTSGNEAEENHYYNEELGCEVYLCEVMDKAWTFETIFGKGYIPVTCKELVDPSPRPAAAVTDNVKNLTADNMFSSMLQANYRFSSVTVTIYQGDQVIQKATCYGHQEEMYEFNLFRFKNETEQTVIQGSIDLTALPAGTYRCTFEARLSTGDNIEFRNFEFTK